MNARALSILLTAGLLSTEACGDSAGTGPSPTFQSLAGTYAGGLVGLTQGIGLNSTFSLTISQSQGSLTGSWGLSGVLNDGVSSLNVAGTGTLTGAIAAGNNPSVNITVRAPGCPNYQAQFSGAYDVSNRRLTIAGPVEFFASNSCNVALSYPSTIILSR